MARYDSHKSSSIHCLVKCDDSKLVRESSLNTRQVVVFNLLHDFIFIKRKIQNHLNTVEIVIYVTFFL